MKNYNWDQVSLESVLPGVTKQVIKGDKAMVIRYVYGPKSVFPNHRHPEEQITLILKGLITFQFDGDSATYGPGDVLVIPPGVSHGALVPGDESVETINLLSPVRTKEIEIISSSHECTRDSEH